MEIKKYTEDYFNDVFEVVHKTIEKIYPKYYPREAVDFFHNHHSKDKMEKQLPNEITFVLLDNNKLIGTGSLFENEIKRFFILPEYQGKGYGKLLLNELEKNIDNKKYNIFILDSSLGAVNFYLKNGYVFKEYKTIELSEKNYLCYLEMYKNINIGYKIFESIENTANGDKSKGESRIMEQLNYEVELEKVYKQIENNKLAVLATCSNNMPTARTMSIVFFDEKIYFQTSFEYTKYKQISENCNVALCILNIQIEGVAELKGITTENDKFIEIFKKQHEDAYKKYSKLDTSRLIEVTPKKFTIWDYDNNGKPSRIFIDLVTKNAYREIEPYVE